ncbi:MAG: hypothetical protein J4F43_08965 [Dehalococcoidia bacterium]|nr:hypothetical protein [Dehalococcoidia bacterium]
MTARGGRRAFLIGTVAAAALAAALWVSPAAGEEEGGIAGRVVNGTAGGQAPSGLDVLLVILGVDGTVDTESATTRPDGEFRFDGVSLQEGSTGRITVNYQGVMYSGGLEPDPSSGSVDLLVYEPTDSLEAVRVSGDVLLIRAADGDEEALAAFEIAEVVNEGDRTFVPDLEQPAAMKFLRFSMPPEASELDVSSDLAGGGIINVGSGFALTAPLPPGVAQVAYTYRLPYQGNRVELSRTFPLGADAFRLLMETETGTVGESEVLVPIETAEVDGRSYTVSAASDLEPGARLSVTIEDLPVPSWLDRIGDGLASTSGWRVAIPSAVGLIMAALLLYAVRRGPAQVLAPVSATPGGGASPWGSGDPTQTPPALALMREMASLDDSHHRNDVPEEEYRARRGELMAELVRLRLGSDAPGRREA